MAAAGGVRPGRLRRVPADFPPLFFSRCFLSRPFMGVLSVSAEEAAPQENGWPVGPKDGVVEKWCGDVFRNQGVALRWANRRPFGARTSANAIPTRARTINLRAEGPGVLPAKGTALVIESPPTNNPFSGESRRDV